MTSKMRMITALVLASVLSAAPAFASPPVSGITSTEYNEGTDKAAPFYNPLAVSAIDLTMSDATINALNSDPYSPVYKSANVKITTADGVVTSLSNIGVRLKGQATRTNLNGKAPMKLKFDAFVSGQKFMGLTRMTLNSMIQDPSFVHENMAYRFYRAMGVIAPRSTFSWVTVNGTDFGLYANIESVDGQMIKRWVDAKHIYSSNCYMADLTYYQNGCYDTNFGDADRTDLNAAVAVSQYDGATWWSEVNKVANMEAVINLMATDLYTSNWDGYTDVVQNNYYIVFDQKGKLQIIPWGQDGAYPRNPDAQLDFLGQGPAYRGFGSGERSVMLRKCVAYAPCQSLLVAAEAKAKSVADSLNMPSMKNKIAKVINNAYISFETRSNANVGDASNWQNWLDTFFPNRSNALVSFLSGRNPETPELAVTGFAVVGSTLTASASTWDFTASLALQWYRNGAPISNQTGNSYLLTKADQDKSIYVVATVSKGILPSASATSQSFLIESPIEVRAVISGTPEVGSVLAASPLASPGTTVVYKWLRDGKPISGGNKATYTLTSNDYLKSISVNTTVTVAGVKNISTSKSLEITSGTMPAIQIRVNGSPVMAKTLSASTTGILSASKVSYQWLRDAVAISAATRSTYTLKAEDTNHTITLRVVVSKTGYVTEYLLSEPSEVSEGTLTKTPKPTVSGTAKLGKTLTVTTGTWDAGTKLTYQWLRNGNPIDGATTKSYKISTLDTFSQISVEVTGIKPGYKPAITLSDSLKAN